MSENSKNEYFKKNDQDFYKNLLFWISQKKNVIIFKMYVIWQVIVPTDTLYIGNIN